MYRNLQLVEAPDTSILPTADVHIHNIR